MKHEPFRSAAVKICGYKICRLSTVYDYCKEHNGIIRVYDDSCEYPARPLCKTREDFEANNISEPVMRPAYYIYVSKLQNAVIFGKEDLIFAGNCCLADRKKQIQGVHHYISRNIPEIRPNTALVKVPKSPAVIERGIDLTKMWSENIYHFSYEALSRLQLVDAVEEYRTWPLIIDDGITTDAWRKELLRRVNVYNHPVILISLNEPYRVKELIYPSFLNWDGERHLGYAPRMHTMAADYIRERVLANHKPSRTYKNVYIVRGNRLHNEQEVIEVFSRYGIDIVHPKTFSENVDAFMSADNIIGAVGSNMAGVPFSKPGANIYVITPFEFQADNNCFEITDVSRRKLHFIPADVLKINVLLNHTSFTVDISKIEALAQKLSR